MTKNFFLLTTMGSALLAASTLFADSEADNAATTTTAPSPYYYAPETSEFFLYGDWIFWDPVMQDQLNFVLVEPHVSNSNVSPHILTDQNNIKSLNYDFSSGFRVGAGYRFGSSIMGSDLRPFQLGAEYTRLSAEDSASYTSPGRIASDVGFSQTEFQTPLVPSITSTDVFVSSSSDVNLTYNRLDFTVGWPMWLTSNVIFRLSTGGIGAWFNNHWVSTFTEAPSGGFAQVNKTDLKWSWWGGGLYGRGDIFLPVGCGLGFFANGGFGLLLGQMKQKERYTQVTSTQSTTDTANYNFTTFQPMLHTSVGLDYKYWIYDAAMLYLSAGWEVTWWFRMDQFGRINQRDTFTATLDEYFTTDPTDLLFHGLTLRAGLDF